MNILKPFDHLGRFRKIIFWIFGIITAYTILGFLILPFTIKLVAVKKLSEVLNRPVSIESIRLNPYALSLSVNKLNIQEQKEPIDFFSFSTLYANLSSSSIFKLAPVIEELKLDGLFVRVVRIKDTTFNFSDIITPTPAETKPTQPEAAPAPLIGFSVNNIQILNGRAEIDDQVTNKVHSIDNLNLNIPFVSDIGTDVEVFVQPRFSTVFNNTLFELSGKTRPFHDSQETTIGINLKGIDLAYYFDYVPMKTNLKVNSGTLDINARITFSRFKDKEPESNVSGDVSVKDLSIMDIANNQVLKLPLMQTTIAPSSFLAGKVHLVKILLQGLEIGITRDKDGKVNIYNLVPEEQQAKEKPPAAEPAQKNPFTLQVDDIALKDARVFITDFYKSAGGTTVDQTDLVKLPLLSISGTSLDTAKQEVVVEGISAEQCEVAIKRLASGDLNIQVIAPQTATEKPAPADSKTPSWITTVEKLSLRQFSFQGEHLTTEEDSNLTIDEIKFDAQDFSTKPGAKGKIDFSCRLNKSGTITSKGECSIAPVSADLGVDLKKINMADFQPFLAGAMNATLAGGSLSTTGTLKLSQEKGTTTARFVGSSVIGNFALREKDKANDLLKWEQLKVNGVNVGTVPFTVAIKYITLEKFFSKIIINQDKTINLATIVKSEQAASSQPVKTEDIQQQQPPPVQPTAKPAEPLPIAIGKINLKGGGINFTDRSIKPNYTTNLSDINCTVSEISTQKKKPADIAFSSKLNGSAPLKITGTLNPFKDDLSLDLKALLESMDLSPFTPYSGKYVGYKIQKGNLSLDLHYTIEEKKLDSTNDVLIDQFDFGETVKSPDAIDLPVKLGVSLLKDSGGQIKLNLPVNGRLDDPQFSIFGIILKMLRNILIKAATSPFSMIGSMFGSSEDLSYIAFDSGSSLLCDTEKAKLDTLAKALADRPNLSIDIFGFVDVDTDWQGLVDGEFKNQLLAKKSQKKAGKGKSAAAKETSEIAPEEYEKLLKKAYKTAQFEKPKNFLGISKGLPAAEMEELIKKNITITDDDLHALAKERAAAVKGYMVSQGKVDAGRLFLVEPPGLAPEIKENVKNSRVDLRIK